MIQRTVLLLVAGLLLSAPVLAQNNLVIFSEDGKEFFLTVNGIKENSEASSHVKVKGITNDMASVRVALEDNSAPDISQNISFFENNMEFTYRIVMTKRGYKLRPFGQSEIKPTEVNESVHSSSVAVDKPDIQQQESITQVETRTEVEINEVPSSESISMNIGIDGLSLNMDVNIEDNWTEETETTISTTTHTTSSTDTYVTSPEEDFVSHNPCGPAQSDVSRYRIAIENESFADDKLNVAKQALKSACIYTDGVKTLASLFDFEEDRLEFVKYCYDRTFDPDNYFELNSVFTFSSAKDELNEFLESK